MTRVDVARFAYLLAVGAVSIVAFNLLAGVVGVVIAGLAVAAGGFAAGYYGPRGLS